MAKKSFLDLTNEILALITQAEISDVSTATGHAKIVGNFLNQAQNELFNVTNWYSLYKTRVFNTVTYTASTIAFNDANPDTITDSANGLGNFADGMEVLVNGSANNDGVFTVETAAVGGLTLQSTDSLTTEVAGNEIIITAISYPVAADYGKALDLIDITNQRVLIEDITRNFDEADPDINITGIPTHFALQNDQYRLWRIPGDAYKIRERYWKQPATLTTNTDTSDLPIETENAMFNWALFRMQRYLNKFDQADRAKSDYNESLRNALKLNKKKIDKTLQFQSNRGFIGNKVVDFPPNFGFGQRFF